MDTTLVKMVKMRLEGDQNVDWTVTLQDGVVHNFCTIGQGSPEYEDGPLANERVHEHDRPLHDWLMKLNELATVLLERRWQDMDQYVHEMLFDFSNGVVRDIAQFRPGSIPTADWDKFELRAMYSFDTKTLDSVEHIEEISGMELCDDGLYIEANDCNFTPQSLANAAFKYRRDLCIAHLDKCHPEFVGKWDSFEGGVDSWWGFGSVMMHELGHQFLWKASADRTVLIVQ